MIEVQKITRKVKAPSEWGFVGMSTESYFAKHIYICLGDWRTLRPREKPPYPTTDKKPLGRKTFDAEDANFCKGAEFRKWITTS